jgi:redox-sensitive bicupin YhaK (pirin superfamily)
MSRDRAVDTVYRSPAKHMVGDGFPVRSILNPQRADLSPFLLLDYVGPVAVTPAETPRGVGEHPHRGFETVTVVYQGELEHRDSAGNRGTIGPGEVQWMTAGAGVLHEEKHSLAFTRAGGHLQMVQLWVNLPKAHKAVPPRHQALTAKTIPFVPGPGPASEVRVVAGTFGGATGPAMTFSPLTVLDARLAADARLGLEFPAGDNTAVVVLSGTVAVNGTEVVREGEMAVLAAGGGPFTVQAEFNSLVLVLSGRPLGEPVAARGPFVMTTEDEVRQAMADFRAGRFGRLD